MFKKKNLKEIKEKKDNIMNILWIISILFIFIFGIFTLVKVSWMNFNLHKNFKETYFWKVITWNSSGSLEEENKNINILIVWRWWDINDAPNLTDSIILASINKKKKYISMLSLPRDFYVDYWENIWEWKINWMYAEYLWKYKDEKIAMQRLESKVTEITWENIDYYVNIDFEGFIKLIDYLWWVKITVPKNLVDNEYPDNNHGYTTFILRAWTWVLDWEVALKYVRSRKNTGWDFARSERQQQIISAIKDKIITEWYLTSPVKIKSLYDFFVSYVKTDMDSFTMIKLATELKMLWDLKVYSSWLNTSCELWVCDKWWFMYFPQRNIFGSSVVLPIWALKWKISYYDDIKNYSKIIFYAPELFEEKLKISIFSNKEDKIIASELKDSLKRFGLEINTSEKIWKKSELETSRKIIFNSEALNSETVRFLKEYLSTENIEQVLVPKYASDPNTKIEIIY